jgi:purine-binding chemotaxis protein CheW
MNTATSLSTQTKTTRHQVYGSFYLNETELVLGVEHIQEVVNFPAKVTTIPLAPDYLVGIFNLRGAVIPMINVKRVLNFDQVEVTPTQKVAIIDYNGVRIGLLFDSTSEILHIRDEQMNEFQYADHEKKGVIRGAVKLNDGERILQVLDPMALVNIENLPQILSKYDTQENPFAKRRNLKNANRRQCISFGVGKNSLAFEINSIHEIIKMPEMQTSVLENEDCVGMINLRGNVVPVIDFSYFLGFGKNTGDFSEKRIIVMKLDKFRFGLMIDQVDNIVTYYTEDVLPLPLFNQKRAGIFEGVLSKENEADVILLNHDKLLSNQEVRQLTHGHSKLYEQNGAEHSVAQKKKGSQKQVYVSFQMQHLLAVPIHRIREIIQYPEDLLNPPGMPDYVKGVLNLRQEMITLIDLRVLYGFGALSDSSAMKVIVVRKDDLSYGLIVDSVESIVSVDLSEKLEIPKVFLRSIDGQFQNDVEEIVEIKAPDCEKKSYMLLNLDALLARIGK